MQRPRNWRLAGLLIFSLGFSLVPASLSYSSIDDMTPVRLAVLGDRTGGHQSEVYEQIVDEIARLRPDFVMTIGDMIEGYVDDSTAIAAEWDEYRQIISPLTSPIHFTPGNHELWSPMAEAAYRENVGRTYYSFNFDRIHVIVLDVSRWEEPASLPMEQLAWLERDLKTFKNSDYTLVFMHKPFWWETIVHARPDTLHALFRKFGVDAVFSGHLHQYFSVEYEGIKYTCMGSSGGASDEFGELGYHFLWVTLDSRGIHVIPIKTGNVQNWDVMTLMDRKVYQTLRSNGIAFKRPIPLSDDLKITDSRIEFTVDNSVGNYPVIDTMRWICPSDWRITPRKLAIYVPPHEKRTYEISVAGRRASFPPPAAEVTFRYDKDKVVSVRESLPLARVATCTRAKSAPTIDGVLDEAIWSNGETHYFDPTGKRAETEATEVYFAYDNVNLYIAAHCKESRPDSMQVRVLTHDGAVSSDDCLGFFIAPPSDSGLAYQIYFNADGVAFDCKLKRNPEGFMQADVGWNGAYQVKTSQNPDCWVLEASIPLKDFGAQLVQGDQWRINFRRKQARLTKAAEWQTPVEFDPETFGLLEAR